MWKPDLLWVAPSATHSSQKPPCQNFENISGVAIRWAMRLHCTQAGHAHTYTLMYMYTHTHVPACAQTHTHTLRQIQCRTISEPLFHTARVCRMSDSSSQLVNHSSQKTSHKAGPECGDGEGAQSAILLACPLPPTALPAPLVQNSTVALASPSHRRDKPCLPLTSSPSLLFTLLQPH